MAKKTSKHSAPRKKRIKSDFFSKIVNGFKSLSKGKKAIVISLTSIILAAAIVFGVALGIIADLTKDYNYNKIEDPDIDEIEPINDSIMNIALFGIDSRQQGFSGLSDSIMILSVNKDTGDIKLISVMRDSLVAMPEYKGKTYKPNKLNSAYARGGAAYAIKVLNQNFGLDIKEYATVNFYGMAEIIDAVGGLEIEVLQREINSSSGINFCIGEQAQGLGIKNPPYVTKAGTQLLNGMQAVAWARIRAVSNAEGTANDYGRTDRQRVVMEKLLNKALDMDISKYPTLIKAMLPHMQTSLDFGQVLKLATEVLGKKVNFQQTRVPQTDYVISDNYCNYYAGAALYYDVNYASKIIHAIIYDGITQEDYIAQNGIEQNRWYRNLVSGGGGSTSSSKPATSNDVSSTVTGSTDQGSSQTSSTTTSSGDVSSVETPSSEEQGSSEPDDTSSSTPSSSSEEQGTDDPETPPEKPPETPPETE